MQDDSAGCVAVPHRARCTYIPAVPPCTQQLVPPLEAPKSPSRAVCRCSCVGLRRMGVIGCCCVVSCRQFVGFACLLPLLQSPRALAAATRDRDPLLSSPPASPHITAIISIIVIVIFIIVSTSTSSSSITSLHRRDERPCHHPRLLAAGALPATSLSPTPCCCRRTLMSRRSTNNLYWMGGLYGPTTAAAANQQILGQAYAHVECSQCGASPNCRLCVAGVANVVSGG